MSASRHRALAALLVAGAVVVGAAALRTRSGPRGAPSAPSPSASAPDFAPSLQGGGRAPHAAELAGRGRGLLRFTTLLRAARDGRRERVRILVFGDSHVQGGIYPDALRGALAEVLGDGGPGFVHAGSAEHPRRGVRQTTRGLEPRPRAPSSPLPDGRVVGLGGVDFEATSERATASFEVRGASTLAWELCARGPVGARVRVREGDRTRELALGGPPPARLGFETQPPHAFELEVPRGVTLCGLEGLSSEPGVVVDALGVNGARLATVLARDEASFAEAVGHASPDLVIWALGTNETSDEPPRTADFARELGELVARVHRAAPEASCLVVGPTPRLDREAASAAIDVALRDAAASLGCASFSWRAHFGDAARAKEAGALGPDGIHFSGAGYTEMGEALAAALLGDVAPR